MRILQLVTANQLRGAEVFAAQLSDGLAQRGHEVILASLKGNGDALRDITDVEKVGLGGNSEGRLPIDIGAWRALRGLVQAFDPQVVQANGSETLKYAALLRLVRRSLPAVYRNISVMSMWSKSGVKRRAVGSALRTMSHIATVSEAGKRDLVQTFGIAEDRVSVLYRGVGLTPELTNEERGRVRAAVRNEFGLPQQCPLVVHAGSFTAEKNHRQLIESFAEVIASVPEACLLLLGDGPLRSDVEEQFERGGLCGNVVAAGYRSDALALLPAADVLALPSLKEGLPGVVLEAAMAGVPAVAYAVGGVPEAILDGESGSLVDIGDVKGFSAALARLLTDSSLHDVFARRARERAVQQFEVSRSVERFEGLYESLLSPIAPGFAGKRVGPG